MHRKRRWSVQTWELKDIAEKLTSSTWTLCTGIRWNGLVLLNDSVSEDGAQEYAIIREDSGVLVESFTCSWMKLARLAACLHRLAAGHDEIIMVSTWPEGEDPRSRIEVGDGHRCQLCR